MQKPPAAWKTSPITTFTCSRSGILPFFRQNCFIVFVLYIHWELQNNKYFLHPPLYACYIILAIFIKRLFWFDRYVKIHYLGSVFLMYAWILCPIFVPRRRIQTPECLAARIRAQLQTPYIFIKCRIWRFAVYKKYHLVQTPKWLNSRFFILNRILFFTQDVLARTCMCNGLVQFYDMSCKMPTFTPLASIPTKVDYFTSPS